MSNRMTNTLRDEICHRLMRHAFGDREDRLKKQKHDFGVAYLHHVIGAKTAKLLAGLPEGIVPTACCYMVRFPGLKSERFEISSTRIPFSLHTWGTIRLPEPNPGDKMVVEWVGIYANIEALESEKTRAAAETNAILNSCATKKAVRERWPELLTLCPGLLNDDPKGVACTALVVSENLNKRLGLPVEKEGV